jgi:peptide/nickel transport system permease protein
VIRFIVRRLLLSVVVLFGVTLVTSAMLHLTSDPIAIMLSGSLASRDEQESLRRELGLDQPFPVQYAAFLSAAVRGDLGKSIRFQRPALGLVLERLPATMELALAAMLIAVAVAVPMGILSASKPNGLVDYLARFVSLIGQSVPIFWLGILLVLVFSVGLRWLPAGGQLEASSLVLPAVTLGLYPMARISRTLRASMLEVLSLEYCLTARGKGLSEPQIVLRHALLNAALPVVTIIGLQLGVLLGGSVVTETIFAWPGVGRLAVQAVQSADFPLARAIVIVFATILTLVNLVTDVAVAYLNPRVRYA